MPHRHDERQPRGRLLIIEGQSVRRYEQLGCWLAGGLLVSGYVTLFLAFTGRLPWLPANIEKMLGDAGVMLAMLAPLAPAVLALFVMRVYSRRRTGRIVIYSDRIEFEKGGYTTALRWFELACYRDSSSDYIQLVKKGSALESSLITIPTLVEEDRVDVLALLDRNGVPRDA